MKALPPRCADGFVYKYIVVSRVYAQQLVGIPPKDVLLPGKMPLARRSASGSYLPLSQVGRSLTVKQSLISDPSDESLLGYHDVFDDARVRLLWQLFSALDADNSGWLTWEELRDAFSRGDIMVKLLLAGGGLPRNTTAEELLAMIDCDNDGYATFDELKRVFR